MQQESLVLPVEATIAVHRLEEVLLAFRSLRA
jgi:hypothetical protein